jgi:hypothetical protein
MTTDGYGGNIPAFDVLAAADWHRDQVSSPCPACGSPEPARLGNGGCSDCRDDFPRCYYCRRWVGDGTTWLPGYFNVSDGRGGYLRCCEKCWERAE